MVTPTGARPPRCVLNGFEHVLHVQKLPLVGGAGTSTSVCMKIHGMRWAYDNAKVLVEKREGGTTESFPQPFQADWAWKMER